MTTRDLFDIINSSGNPEMRLLEGLHSVWNNAVAFTSFQAFMDSGTANQLALHLTVFNIAFGNVRSEFYDRNRAVLDALLVEADDELIKKSTKLYSIISRAA